MPIINITFKVSEEIARGLADGSYRLLGVVVRDNSGRVVKMLSPLVKAPRAIKGNPKIAIGAVVAAVAAGSAILVYTRFNRKARLARHLAKVDKAIQATMAEHPSGLTRDDLRNIRASIDDFLRATEERAYQDITLSLPEDASRTLIAFAGALRSFSAELTALSRSVEPVPELLAPDRAPELLPLLGAIQAQLAYQDRNWPQADNQPHETTDAPFPFTTGKI
ncbi:MAG: hypothetical protein HY288_11005 [Planctomycetia bacterium]|nr:hypothetical protein [Planctomycetia bacterium]